MEKENVSRIGVSLEPDLLKKFDVVIEDMYYKNRSEAIRDAIREYILKNELKSGKGKQIAVLSLIYDHHKRNVTEVLTELQHRYYPVVQTNLHFHIDRHTCMELIILKGDAGKITEIKNKLTSVSGVKKSDLLITTKMNY